ncbi:MAG: PP2C family protein-serine/threonine phosphatase [Acidobacteriota bacterium]
MSLDRVAADTAIPSSCARPTGQPPAPAVLERLRALTGIDFQWHASGTRPAEGRWSAEIQVGGRAIGILSALPEGIPAGRLEAACALTREWLAHESEISGMADEILRGYEQIHLAHRVSGSLDGASDGQHVCEVVLRETLRLLDAASATVRLHGVSEEEARCWSVRSDSLRGSSAADDCCLEVPILCARGAGEPLELGVLTLRGRLHGGPFTLCDQKLARSMAEQIGVFLRLGLLIDEARQRGRFSREREITREVHSGLLPKDDPRLPGLIVAGACLPGEEIGGDHYGYLNQVPEVLNVMLAKVSERGVRAAVAMATVRALLRAEVSRNDSPAEALRAANHVLARDLQPSGLYATALLARYDCRNRRLRYAGAGHSSVLLWRAADGRFERLESNGLAMGIFEDVVYEQGEIELAPGDLLTVFTDSVTETRNRTGECFGLERLCHEIMRHRRERPRTLIYRILESVEAFRAPLPQRDNLTLVVLRAVREGA